MIKNHYRNMEDTSKAIKISGMSFIACIKHVNCAGRWAKLANLLIINDRCNFSCVLTVTHTLSWLGWLIVNYWGGTLSVACFEWNLNWLLQMKSKWLNFVARESWVLTCPEFANIEGRSDFCSVGLLECEKLLICLSVHKISTEHPETQLLRPNIFPTALNT